MQSVLSTWDDPCVDAGIEAHQHPLMMHSEGQQINVCDLAMGHHLITTNGGRRRPGERIGPEPMVGMRQQSDQQRHHCCWRTRAVGVAGMPQDAQNTVLGERTRCPARRRVLSKPVMGRVVMHVLRIQQGNQHVQIRQSYHGNSSRS